MNTIYLPLAFEPHNSTIFQYYFVPRTGVEPARPYGHLALNQACLPIPAPGQKMERKVKQFFNYKTCGSGIPID